MGCASSVESVAADSPGQDFFASYVLAGRLGRGACGQVRAVRRKSASPEEENHLAAKVITINDGPEVGQVMAMIKNEISCWQQIGDHPNIVRLEKVYLQRAPTIRCAYLLMERCGPSLKSSIQMFQGDEQRSAAALHGVLCGLQRMHECRIVHRDVKLDNILFSREHGSEVKLCDFGVAGVIPSCGHFSSVTGTAPYMAPEVVQGKKYAFAVDLWSSGVCFFLLHFQQFPYKPAAGESGAAAFKRAIDQGTDVSFEPSSGKPRLSIAASQLCSALLARDADRRPSAEVALGDRLFRELATQTPRLLDDIGDESGGTC